MYVSNLTIKLKILHMYSTLVQEVLKYVISNAPT
jgi:hypothetical protein